MSSLIILSILVLLIQNFVTGNFLEVENGYLTKPMQEKNNVVNKGVWVRSKGADNSINNKLEDFIFRPNSLDVDNMIQGDSVGDFISAYVERQRRDTRARRQGRKKRSVTNCKGKTCNNNNIIKDAKIFEHNTVLTKLKPTSVFNDYPYEVAALLDSTTKELIRAQNVSERAVEDKNSTLLMPLDEVKTNYSINIQTIINDDKTSKDAYNLTDENNDSPVQRHLEIEYVTKLVKKNEYMGDFNRTNDDSVSRKVDRDVFDKADRVWKQNVPFPQTTRYNVIPKNDVNARRNRPITEKGLIKVLAMLTKTFKKIVKQHDDIKEIHKKMHTMHKDFVMNVNALTEKFKNFDTKYSNLLEVNERIRELEDKFNATELYFKTKENEFSNNLIDFENQQKKFLTQQRQFYNIQKLMLAQNEKINAKQNQITKTQCEISHRQNNFARILKKAKQIYVNRHDGNSKIASFLAKPTVSDSKNEDSEIIQAATEKPTTESIKINLFSIPSITRLENQDHLLLNERDEQPVDDLVYKYYFNNTFLDNLMKSKIFSSFVEGSVNSESNNAKNKRNNEMSHLHTTILLPVKKASIVEQLLGGGLNRKRRWINHHSRRSRRKNRGQTSPELNLVDDKFRKMTWKSATDKNTFTKTDNELNSPPEGMKTEDPFLSMAKTFCTSIGQNTNTQSLEWCIEKALRRLQGIDTRLPNPVAESNEKPLREREVTERITIEPSSPANESTTPVTEKKMESPSSVGTTTNLITTAAPVKASTGVTTSNVFWTDAPSRMLSNMFFPDNDKLEDNLKQYELKPDTEGTIYYDGSLHASDVLADKSEGFSDLLSELESNSRIEVDPATFDLQAKRRAIVRQMNENILKKMSRRPYGYTN